MRVVSSDTIIIAARNGADDAQWKGNVYIFSLTDGSLLSTLSNPGTNNQFGFTMDVDETTGKLLAVDRTNKGYIFEA